MWRSEGRLLADVRYAARVLARQRGFAAVAILTTALALALAGTLFSVVDAVLLRPLPWPGGDRLVRFTETHAGATRDTPLQITSATYLALQSLSGVEPLNAWSRNTLTVAGPDGNERLPGAFVTPGIFPMLRTRALIGRVFDSDDAREAVLSYGFWTARFGSSRDVIGRALRINDRVATIVGVMPPDFEFPDRDTRVWLPLRVPQPPAVTMLNAIARLRAGATPAGASDEATALVAREKISTNALLAMFGSAGAPRITAQSALDAATHDVRPGIIALFAAGALLLVMALANLASLQLARATTRHRELAIRSALGAGTRRLVQQLMVEQALLAAAGGALGLALTVALHRALPAVLPADFPRVREITVRLPVVFAVLGLASATGVVLGLVPAWQQRRLRITRALAENAAGSIGGAHTRARASIMTAQIAIASALLIMALLLGRSFAAMMSQDRGFDPRHLVTARLLLPDATFPPAARIEAVEQLAARAGTLPGSPTIAVTTGMPLSGSENITGFEMPSLRAPVGAPIHVHAVRSVVTPGYLDALGVRLLAGRDFRPDDDSPSAAKVVVVNRTFARAYLTSRALGDRIHNFMNDDGIDYEVIGIVEDMQRKGLREQIQPEIYSLLRQSPRPSTAPFVVIRTAMDAAPLAGPLRRLVHDIAPGATIDSIQTMDDRILVSLAKPRLYALLLGGFAIAALVIAAVGLGGVLSYSVAQRAREFALRVALGAKPRQILRLVLGQGLMVTVAGLGVGVLAALFASRYVATLLYGVSAHDTASFVAAPIALAAIALLACASPAVRAMRVDTLRQLRQ